MAVFSFCLPFKWPDTSLDLLVKKGLLVCKMRCVQVSRDALVCHLDQSKSRIGEFPLAVDLTCVRKHLVSQDEKTRAAF